LRSDILISWLQQNRVSSKLHDTKAASPSFISSAAAQRSAHTTGDRAAPLLGHATPRDVFIAHELYHHIEAVRPEVPIARRYRPTLFRIGNWHWRTGVAALAEIAAGAFAQSLLDLPSHPRALDFVAVDAIAPSSN
jgi:hypothetical protein